MLTNISWGSYATVVALLFTSWYLFVGFRFYFTDIRDILSGRRKIRIGNDQLLPIDEQVPIENMTNPVSREISTSAFAVEDPTFNDVDTLIEQLKATIADAAQRNVLRDEFFTYLQFLLREFPTVKNSPFRSSVSEFIVSECAKIGTISITQEEAEGLWN